MKAAIFLERDGVINEVGTVSGRQQIPVHVADFQVRKDVLKSLDKLKAAGFLVIVTTNQPGLSGGDLNRTELDMMHGMLLRALPIDDILMCPHAADDDCHCRKPEAGLFTEARFKWKLDMDLSFTISDKWQDAAAAHVAGCTSVLIESPYNGTGHHDFIVKNLTVAVDKILSLYTPSEEPARATRSSRGG